MAELIVPYRLDTSIPYLVDHFDVLDDCLEYSTVFFMRADGLSLRRARARAHEALRIAPAKWRLAVRQTMRARWRERRDEERFEAKLEAFLAAYQGAAA